MKWLTNIVDALIANHPEGEIIISSGVSPSGTYHLGTLREVMTAEAVRYEVERRGRSARHIHVVDDLDVFRKVPVNVPDSFSQYLGRPLCDVPSPDGGDGSYADYYLKDLLVAIKALRLKVEIKRAHDLYKQGYFVRAIETALANSARIKNILENISGHKVDPEWSPIQVLEDGYLKNRHFISIDQSTKSVVYQDGKGRERTVNYASGHVKLNWRIDWPARWWMLGVDVEPFGRDHATKGGSYDTGRAIVHDIYNAKPPLPIPYNFIMQSGETKKMSKSAGNVVAASELLQILPPEVVWYFLLRYAPDKQLVFDQNATFIRLIDDFGTLLANTDRGAEEEQLLDLCLHAVNRPTVSRVPFSHLVASYQASLKNINQTFDVLKRSEYVQVVDEETEIIRAELKYIDEWLKRWAPDDSKFTLLPAVDVNDFTEIERDFLYHLADKIAQAPAKADGAWFHAAVYNQKEFVDLDIKDMFTALYRVLIGKDSGPRAGYFLSILPRAWLIKRLRLEE